MPIRRTSRSAWPPAFTSFAPSVPALAFALGLSLVAGRAVAQSVSDWPQHSTTRPQPPVVDVGRFGVSVPAPSDAVVLFDGRALRGWHVADSAAIPARWKVQYGYMQVVPHTGAIATDRAFGDVQLHIEWSTPTPATGEGQERGNSGVFFMGRYELQVLDSWRNITYPDGQAGAIYGQFPPLVNASRGPGQWQSYDVVFHRPHFDAAGKLLSPARMTAFQNGVLIQDNAMLVGPTSHQERLPYSAHADRLPLELQDHGRPVRFRNIWVRELPGAG
jgi:hypothetical protein